MKKINKYLLSIVCLLLLLTGCNNKTTSKTNKNNDTNDDNISLEKKGHTITTSVGNFIVDKDGSVYYINIQEKAVQGTVAELTEKDLSILGTKKEYKNFTYTSDPLCDLKNGCPIEAYKLNLTNISSVYEVLVGNGAAGPTIILLSYDGIVHELSFNLYVEKNQVEFTTNISKYPNIVSVVKNMQFGGHGAMLIDSNGNKYDYNEAKNN